MDNKKRAMDNKKRVLKKGSILTVHIKTKKFLYICKMDISKMSNFKNTEYFFFRKCVVALFRA